MQVIIVNDSRMTDVDISSADKADIVRKHVTDSKLCADLGEAPLLGALGQQDRDVYILLGRYIVIGQFKRNNFSTTNDSFLTIKEAENLMKIMYYNNLQILFKCLGTSRLWCKVLKC